MSEGPEAVKVRDKIKNEENSKKKLGVRKTANEQK